MAHERFEDLPVWQEAIELGLKTYALPDHADFQGRGSLRDQIERAAVSVSNNIAEGFERGTTQELLTFLYIARGSAGEVRSMLCLLEQMTVFRNLKFSNSNDGLPIPWVQVDGRKAPPDNDFWTRSHRRTEPCVRPIVP